MYLEIEIRRVSCKVYGKVKQETLDWLSKNPFYTDRFMYWVGRRCRKSSISDVAKECRLDWKTVKDLEKEYMKEQLEKTPEISPRAIGIDEISVKKGHVYRIVISDLDRKVPIWFGGIDSSEASMNLFYEQLGPEKCANIKISVMDMWKAFEKSAKTYTSQTAILYDKFHILKHLRDALDTVRKSEYARLTGDKNKYIKGSKWILLSNIENLSKGGRKSLKALMQANSRLAKAYVLRENFKQLWNYRSEKWALKFFEN